VESVPAGAKESRDLSPTAGARGSASGAVMAGGSGDGTGNGEGSGGIGQGSSMGGPFELQMGVGGGPRFVRKALPRYPRAARELGKEGTVLLRLTIDERGRLVDVEVMQKAGMGFEEEAVRAVRESKFCAASKNGNPVACRVLLPIRFVLRNSEGG
jgi:protein TonB